MIDFSRPIARVQCGRPARFPIVVATVAVCLAFASTARAQAPIAGRLEIGVGIERIGGIGFGAGEATLTGSGGNRFHLFSSDTSLEGTVGVAGTLGVSLSRTFQAEGFFSYAKPSVHASLSNDAEQAAPIVASDTLQQFIIGANLVAHLRRWTLGNRAVPFVSAGGGYLRELHDGSAFAQGGQAYRAGAGIKYQLTTRRGRLKGIGLRAEASAVARRKGAALDTRARVAPAVAAGVFARF